MSFFKFYIIGAVILLLILVAILLTTAHFIKLKGDATPEEQPSFGELCLYYLRQWF